MIAQLVCNVELDVEEIINTIIGEYGYESANEVKMDDIFYYISDHINYLQPTYGGRGIETVEDGPSISGFDERTYDDVEEILESMQDWN